MIAPIVLFASVMSQSGTLPPAPCGPVPNANQLSWHKMQYYAFVHFGMNTFTNREWGEGTESTKDFNPTQLDCRQWVRAFKDAGMKGVILTAKHHDGFCLWPSKYTEHSVKNSPWKNGKGDVVKELSEACKEYGLKFGVYLSPWDRHEPTYGDSPRYNQHYMDQLTELLTHYGPIFEVWWDGACGEGPNGKKQVYDWDAFRAVVRKLQPHAVIFSDVGDVRWVGNEDGVAGDTNWSTFSSGNLQPGQSNPNQTEGNEDGNRWAPAETDVSIRPGWFNHAAEDDKVKSLDHLMTIYLASIGRNSNLLLNVPADKRGLIHENDVARLKEFREEVDRRFKNDLARGARVSADSTRGNDPQFGAERAIDGDPATYWAPDDGVTTCSLTIVFRHAVKVSYVRLAENIQLGQRVKSFTIEKWENKAWVSIAHGTTIGYNRIVPIDPLTTDRIRVRILDAKACPTISTIAVY